MFVLVYMIVHYFVVDICYINSWLHACLLLSLYRGKPHVELKHVNSADSQHEGHKEEKEYPLEQKRELNYLNNLETSGTVLTIRTTPV